MRGVGRQVQAGNVGRSSPCPGKDPLELPRGGKDKGLEELTRARTVA